MKQHKLFNNLDRLRGILEVPDEYRVEFEENFFRWANSQFFTVEECAEDCIDSALHHIPMPFSYTKKGGISVKKKR